MKEEPYRSGMVITRNVDGEVVQLDAIKPDVLERMKMMERMEMRRVKYLAEGNRKALLRLASEYEKKLMPTLAGVIRKQAGGYRPSVQSRKKKSRKSVRSDKGRKHGKRQPEMVL